jgi:hypothetical protein
MELIVASLSFLAVSPEGAVEGTDELLTGHSFSYLSRQVASAAGISISCLLTCNHLRSLLYALLER